MQIWWNAYLSMMKFRDEDALIAEASIELPPSIETVGPVQKSSDADVRKI